MVWMRRRRGMPQVRPVALVGEPTARSWRVTCRWAAAFSDWTSARGLLVRLLEATARPTLCGRRRTFIRNRRRLFPAAVGARLGTAAIVVVAFDWPTFFLNPRCLLSCIVRSGRATIPGRAPATTRRRCCFPDATMSAYSLWLVRGHEEGLLPPHRRARLL